LPVVPALGQGHAQGQFQGQDPGPGHAGNFLF